VQVEVVVQSRVCVQASRTNPSKTMPVLIPSYSVSCPWTPGINAIIEAFCSQLCTAADDYMGDPAAWANIPILRFVVWPRIIAC
jgi:hypothetical protein